MTHMPGPEESNVQRPTNMQSNGAQRCPGLAGGRAPPLSHFLMAPAVHLWAVKGNFFSPYRCGSAGGGEAHSFEPCRRHKTHLWWVHSVQQLFSFYALTDFSQFSASLASMFKKPKQQLSAKQRLLRVYFMANVLYCKNFNSWCFIPGHCKQATVGCHILLGVFFWQMTEAVTDGHVGEERICYRTMTSQLNSHF